MSNGRVVRRTGRTIDHTGQHRNNPKRRSAQGEKNIILSRTIMFTDLPAWIQGDEHIRRGYRVSGKSVPEYVQSLGYLHNEIVNIWLHLLGATCMVALLIWSFVQVLHQGYDISGADLGIRRFYQICNIGCLLFSVRNNSLLRLLS